MSASESLYQLAEVVKTIERAAATGTINPNERWVRLPPSGYCEYSGLSRSHLNRLVSAGRIKSCKLAEPGSKGGVRLIWLQSLMDYIENNADFFCPRCHPTGVQEEG